MKKLMFVFGTRPEAIKMVPLILLGNKLGNKYNIVTVITGQHAQMVNQILDFFDIKYQYNLNVMKPSQTLFDISSSVMTLIEPIITNEKPDIIFVQGDTTTAFVAALAGFYLKTPVAHIEAGLRSGNIYSPFPEEVNRKLISNIATFHFTPTQEANLNLEREGNTKNMYCVGNTVIDALKVTIKKIDNNSNLENYFSFLRKEKVILLTAHRRESFGEPLINICNAIIELTEKFSDIEIVFPVHPNPNVRETVFKLLGNNRVIHLIEPLDYPYLIWLLNKSYLVLSDSGGLQEEAPSLGKPVLVLRDVTERMEGVAAGTAKLVGTNQQTIVTEVTKLLTDIDEYKKMAKAVNPYGDGTSSLQIFDVLENYFAAK